MSLIGSSIQPDKTHNLTARTVHFGPSCERAYTFTDRNHDGHYVADVDNAEDAAALLASGSFYSYQGNGKPPVELNPAPRAAAAAAPAAEVFMPDVLQEAEDLVVLSPAKMAIQLGKVSSLSVARAALGIETRNGKARPAVEKLLRDTIEMAAAAGSKA